MEKKLEKLFDYQRFEQNARLARMIEEAEGRFAQGLSDEDLLCVNAAGTQGMVEEAKGCFTHDLTD